MRVMAAMSRRPAGRMGTSVMVSSLVVANDETRGRDAALQKKSAPAVGPGRSNSQLRCWASAAVAEEAQQEQEQVDEVEIERQRAHHGLAGGDGAVVHHVIHVLDLLGVPSGEAGEDQHAGGR